MRRYLWRGSSMIRHTHTSSSTVLCQRLRGLCFSTESTRYLNNDKVSFKNHGPISQQRTRSIRQDVETKIRKMIQSIQSETTFSELEVQGRRSYEIHNLMRRWVSLRFESIPSGLNSSGKIIEELLDAVITSYERHSAEANANMKMSLMPTIQMYKYAIEACILPTASLVETKECPNLGRHTTAYRAEKILHRLIDFIQSQCDNNSNDEEIHEALLGRNRHFLDQTTDVSSIINSSASLLIHALLKESGNKNHINKAEHIVERMYGLQNVSEIGWSANTTFNNALINMLICKGGSTSIPQSESILQKMILQVDSKGFGPNLLSFHLVLRGFAKEGNVKAAETLLDTFQSLSHKELVDFEPDTTTYNIMLNAYAKCGDRHSCEKARQMLVWMIEEGNKNNNSTLSPDIVSYTAVINTLSKGGRAKEAHNLLTQVVTNLELGKSDIFPDHIVFSAVVDAWAKSKDENAVEKCWKIIDLMKKLSMTTGKSTFAPSTITFNSLLSAIGRSKRQDIGDQVMNVLKYMEDLDNEYSHISSRPNIVTYNSAISILGKANRFEEAKNLFYQVCAVKPQIVNTITYNSFLNALSWRPSRDASHQALSVLKEMNEPNTRTYNTVMKVLSKNKCYDQMEGLLDQMENLSKKRTPLIIPNTITYATLISAYTRSSRPDKISRVMNVLKRMDSAKKAGNEFAVPDTKIYNGILKSNLYSNSMKNVSSLEMNETLENAREIFQIMMSSSSSKCNPDEFTYAVMFQILAKNIPGRNERLEEISNLFMSCREDGMNNGYVLSELRKVIPKSLYQELTR